MSRDHQTGEHRVTARAFLVLAFVASVTASIAAQTRPPDEIVNPLQDLHDKAKDALSVAGVPLTDDQEKAIALMMEDRRAASEELSGQTMDFRGGPVDGQQLDRALAAIQWMESEFTKRLG